MPANFWTKRDSLNLHNPRINRNFAEPLRQSVYMTTKQLDKILIFEPIYKSVIRGGEQISRLKGKSVEASDIGESWELSPVEGHESVVADGPHKGLTISELTAAYGSQLLGQRSIDLYGNTFPLLIKLIDAHDMLSLQVHPDDDMAQRLHNSRGKSEMWYVIDAKKGARIYCGLSKKLSPETLDENNPDGSIMDYIASYASQPGQFYFIPTGTIHSMGSGNLIAEIQEASDITYRIFDHNRKDPFGKPRQLHIRQAREAIDFTFPHHIEPTARIFDRSTVNAVSSRRFEVDYIQLDGKQPFKLSTDHGSFTVILVTDGSVTICADGNSRTITAGHTALIPAYASEIVLSGCGIALGAHV